MIIGMQFPSGSCKEPYILC